MSIQSSVININGISFSTMTPMIFSANIRDAIIKIENSLDEIFNNLTIKNQEQSLEQLVKQLELLSFLKLKISIDRDLILRIMKKISIQFSKCLSLKQQFPFNYNKILNCMYVYLKFSKLLGLKYLNKEPSDIEVSYEFDAVLLHIEKYAYKMLELKHANRDNFFDKLDLEESPKKIFEKLKTIDLSNFKEVKYKYPYYNMAINYFKYSRHLDEKLKYLYLHQAFLELKDKEKFQSKDVDLFEKLINEFILLLTCDDVNIKLKSQLDLNSIFEIYKKNNFEIANFIRLSQTIASLKIQTQNIVLEDLDKILLKDKMKILLLLLNSQSEEIDLDDFSDILDKIVSLDDSFLALAVCYNVYNFLYLNKTKNLDKKNRAIFLLVKKIHYILENFKYKNSDYELDAINLLKKNILNYPNMTEEVEAEFIFQAESLMEKIKQLDSYIIFANICFILGDNISAEEVIQLANLSQANQKVQERVFETDDEEPLEQAMKAYEMDCDKDSIEEFKKFFFQKLREFIEEKCRMKNFNLEFIEDKTVKKINQLKEKHLFLNNYKIQKILFFISSYSYLQLYVFEKNISEFFREHFKDTFDFDKKAFIVLQRIFYKLADYQFDLLKV
jgi:hypothetical protein